MSRRLVRELLAVHAACAALVGLAWHELAPRLTYTVVDGEATLLDETEYVRIFGGDATFAMLGALAGLACAGVVLGRRHTGVGVPLGLAVGGTAGSLVAWWIGVLLGPGRLSVLAEQATEAEVTAGPELAAYGTLLVWPLVAVGIALVAAAVSGPDRTRRRRSPSSAE